MLTGISERGRYKVCMMRTVNGIAAAALALALSLVSAAYAEEAVTGASPVRAAPVAAAPGDQGFTETEAVLNDNRTALLVLVGLVVLMGAAMMLWSARIRKKGLHRTATAYPGHLPEDEEPVEKNTSRLTTPVP